MRLFLYGILTAGAVIFYGLGLLLLLAGGLILVADWDTRSIPSKIAATGTIIKVESPLSSSATPLMCPTVRFVAQNKRTYEHRKCQTTVVKEVVVPRSSGRGGKRIKVMQPHYRSGESVTIWYLPSNPQDAIVAEKYTHPFKRLLKQAWGLSGWSIPIFIAAKCLERVAQMTRSNKSLQ